MPLSVEVEFCASKDKPDAALFDYDKRNATPSYFKLSMADNSAVTTGFRRFKHPAFVSGELLPGECRRGWIEFDTPEGSVARAVRFEPTTPDTVVWALSR